MLENGIKNAEKEEIDSTVVLVKCNVTSCLALLQQHTNATKIY
jgi:hypothetical protein